MDFQLRVTLSPEDVLWAGCGQLLSQDDQVLDQLEYEEQLSGDEDIFNQIDTEVKVTRKLERRDGRVRKFASLVHLDKESETD